MEFMQRGDENEGEYCSDLLQTDYADEEFEPNVEEIEDKIVEKNKEGELKNRVGPVKLPYTLLYPSSDGGLTGRGIPNSTSI